MLLSGKICRYSLIIFVRDCRLEPKQFNSDHMPNTNQFTDAHIHFSGISFTQRCTQTLTIAYYIWKIEDRIMNHT